MLDADALKRLAREARNAVQYTGMGSAEYDRLAAMLFLKLVEAEERR